MRKKIFNYTHTSAYLSYLSLVFIEGHGIYRFAAAALAVTMVIGHLLGLEEE